MSELTPEESAELDAFLARLTPEDVAMINQAVEAALRHMVNAAVVDIAEQMGTAELAVAETVVKMAEKTVAELEGDEG